MFFILSKILIYLTQPIVIVCLFFLISVLVRKQILKKRFFWVAFILLFFFTNDFITNEVMCVWEIKPTAFDHLKKKYKYGILLTGVTIGKREPNDRVYFNKAADRVIHTVQLYKLGCIEKILISGGSGQLIQEDDKEADELKDVMLMMGVSAQDIVLENKSRNTHESAVEVKKILEKQHIEPQTCILVTSAFHIRRSLACFKKVDLPVDIFSTDFYSHPRYFTPDALIIPNSESLIIWSKLSKEWFGFIAYALAGYV